MSCKKEAKKVEQVLQINGGSSVQVVLSKATPSLASTTNLSVSLQEIDQQIAQCQLCRGLVEKFPTAVSTVFLGQQQELVLLGEAPAPRGWRQSHKPWRDETGKVIPSGVILQRLFAQIERDPFQTTFLEAVKCYPLERKSLKFCSTNCHHFTQAQLQLLQPKIILAMGEFATRRALNFKFEKFSEVAGQVFHVEGQTILPIFHPSPASPQSYKGNLPIFAKLKELLAHPD